MHNNIITPRSTVIKIFLCSASTSPGNNEKKSIGQGHLYSVFNGSSRGKQTHVNKTEAYS